MNTVNKTLTVFTPAFNRDYSIHLCYESLCRQTCKDFVWLVVDDGSTDNTAKLIEEWQKKDNGFEIRYVYKENGGMHTAHNTAYKNIDTELNVCIDSDDYMTDDAVEKIVNFWKENGSEKYAGIIALDVLENGKIIGKELEKDRKDTTLGGYYKRGGSGDKKLIYRTDVMKKYPAYPEFQGEKYVSLAYKYSKADKDYTLLIMNEPVCVVEYMEDGSSTNMYKQYLRNPKGFAFIRKNDMIDNPDIKDVFRNCVHYVSSSIISKNSHFVSESPKKALTVLAIPFGVALTVHIKRKAKGFMKVEGFTK
ncbi:MAG: glycosyltransferase family 2 protein [Ruminococcus sp.]|nr:glycosyltransferase family 2 protein [Candidatus Copronaster equi]